jgi:hypothetical protein
LTARRFKPKSDFRPDFSQARVDNDRGRGSRGRRRTAAGGEQRHHECALPQGPRGQDPSLATGREISRYDPPPSTSPTGFSPGLALRITVSVSGWGQLCGGHSLVPNVAPICPRISVECVAHCWTENQTKSPQLRGLWDDSGIARIVKWLRGQDLNL